MKSKKDIAVILAMKKKREQEKSPSLKVSIPKPPKFPTIKSLMKIK